jgi:hypothetical protein
VARPVCFVLDSVLLPMHVIRCAVHGICVLSVDTRASVLVEKSTVMRIATVMISYRVRCSDKYDTLAHDLIRNKYAAKQPSQDR